MQMLRTGGARATDALHPPLEGRVNRASGVALPQAYARAYLPRPKKRSLLSSVALSRLDLMSACLAIIALTAGRALISSNQRFRFGFSFILAPCCSCARVHGKVAMSAIEYSSPPRYLDWPSRVLSNS